MIKSVTVTNHLNESVKMELARPEKSGFAVVNIDGIGPSKADINTNQFASHDGSFYTSARVTERNIVLSLRFMFNPTIEHMRQKTYKYFPIKKRVRLLFETDNRTCEIYGYVEDNIPAIFSKEAGAQISIICPDPYFYSAGVNGKTVSVFYGMDPLFEFPFFNDSLTEDLMEFGQIISKTSQTIYYEGDADVGIVINMKALGSVKNISIFNTQTREAIKLNTDRLAQLTGEGIKAGDEIRLSTVKGNKYVTLLRQGNYINILNCLDKNVDWLQLSKGDNILAYDAEEGFTNLEFRIENQTIYEGV